MRRITLIAALAACAPSAPEVPTWTEDVMPILRANCVRCHGEDTSGGAPTTFRLDRFASAVDPWSFERPGAFTMRQRIAVRMQHEGEGSVPPMPPNGPALSDRQKEILENWSHLTIRGDALGAANSPPRIRLGEPLPANADEEVTIRTLVEDDDHDYVGGELWYGATEPEVRITRRLRSGVGTHLWDSGAAPPGTWQVFAVLLDDSRDVGGVAERITQSLGQVTIAHAGGTLPRLSFDDEEPPTGCASVTTRPRRDDLFHPSLDPAARTITVFAFDPDGPPSVTLEAIGPMTVALGTATPNPVNPCELTLVPDLSTIPDGTTWRIRATWREGDKMRQAVSEMFIVSNATTSLTYAEDIEPLLRDPPMGTISACQRCEACHEGDCTGFVVDAHVGPGSIDDFLGKIYRKVVEREEMPPESARSDPGFDPWLTRDERDLIGEWILGGAPP